ncbi:hypothetical protein, partial [Cobetia amphilecti]|uniref:hypothetical protein n=1 Tax=Cobetia amphilecti TaxID=1055104 RepID=UPI001427D951
SISTYTPVSFSPALYKSYGYGVSNEQNKKLISFHGTPIFYDFSKNALVNKPAAHCSEVELVSTTCGNIAMRISSGNYISLSNEGFVATVDNVHHSAKIVRIKDEDKYFISSPNGQKFLGATKQDFVIKTKLSEWEKFMIL